MNLTLRIETDRKSYILKQARPWVEKYDHIAAPWNRMSFEHLFYDRAAHLAGVGTRMPTVLEYDPAATAILLEDLSPATDFSCLYQGGGISHDEIHSLALYLASLHQLTRDQDLSMFANEEMRSLNAEHIFRVPLSGWAGRNLDTFEPGFEACCVSLAKDDHFVRAIADLEETYCSPGPVLVHGDFFPGSWLQAKGTVYVIDAEFSHAGHAEHDVGVALAHLVLTEQSPQKRRHFVSAYREAGGRIDADLLTSFTAIEIFRRLAGVAQLPLPSSRDARKILVQQARENLLLPHMESYL